MSGDRFDLAVVGLGAVGSAALCHASCREGLRVIGIDRHRPPHDMGSSHAETRVTRLAVGEGDQYLPFVARSHEIWRELEARTGERLLYQPGGYIVTPPGPTGDERWGGFVSRTAEVAARAGIDFRVRTPAEVQAHLPNVVLRGDEHIGFEPTGGIVMCERAIAAQLRLAGAAGARIETDLAVDRLEPIAAGLGGGVRVHAGPATFTAERVVVATGAWFGDLAGADDAGAVTVTRQVVFWFEVDDPEPFSAEHFPFLIWSGDTIADYCGVFPMPPGGTPGLKMLGEQFDVATTADTVDRRVSAAEIDAFHEHLVVPRVLGVRRNTVRTAVCLYTNTRDDHFLIDRHPASDAILTASPCSGHGFKHSTALGEAMVELMVDGGSRRDLTPFARR